jgi:hypothetical protein
MTHKEMIDFIVSLSDSITDDLISDVLNNKIPPEWDGIEIRQLLSDKYLNSTYKMSRSRKAKYNNSILINNL